MLINANFKWLSLSSIKQRQWALALLLITLHGVILWGFDSILQRALIICHYGFFLLWQPIWRTKDRLSVPAAISFLFGAVVLIFFVSWWLIAFWLAGLFGILGGRVFSSREQSTRTGYLLAAGYLLSVLLMWVVPKLLDATQDVMATQFVVQYILPLFPLSIIFTKIEAENKDQPPILDLFYTLLLALSAMILVLGSFAIQASSQSDYVEVIFKVLFGLALTLIVISWLWNPRAGFTGIGQILSRYLLSVGMPFEQWVRNIAELAEQESSPEQFTLSAMHEVLALPWVSGLSWETPEGHGKLGSPAKFQSMYEFHQFKMTLYTSWPLTPALTIHVKLLTQILGEFYEAKRREETMRQNTYMQAVYETGARLTHDIKNLVQSMSALCKAAEVSSEEDNERLLALIRRQLPQLNQRLAMTLDKLEAPRKTKTRQMKLTLWWNSLHQRYAQNTNIKFNADELSAIEIDAEVLDSVTDNLLQNAIEKSKHQPDIEIRCEMIKGEKFILEVSDNGRAMPANIAEQLFKKHVSSENGLGIGLYHAGKQASQSGLKLDLVDNQNGEVRFRLAAE